MKKVIFHIDVNSAFLSWEAANRLKENPQGEDLRLLTAAVGGDQQKRHGIILAKSISAKKFGVRTGESILEARKKCPHLLLVPANYPLYREYSQAFQKILREYTPDVEPFSIDEAFMDMTGTQLLFGEPLQAAETIRRRMKKELGFTVNIGISSNKLLAKMASDFEKPDKIHTLFPEEIQEKMWHLPVEQLFFVGRATAGKLHQMGIETIGDLAKTEKSLLKKLLKKQGETIWNFANGIDFSVVQSQPVSNKGYGNSTTMSFDVTDTDTAKTVLLALSETVGTRLREHQVLAEAISVEIKDTRLKSLSHQCTLDCPTDITNEIYQTAGRLFEEAWNGSPIRLLGVSAIRVTSSRNSRQLGLFDTQDYEKWEKLDDAIDKIRGKYGKDSIQRAAFLNKKNIDHMYGKRLKFQFTDGEKEDSDK